MPTNFCERPPQPRNKKLFQVAHLLTSWVGQDVLPPTAPMNYSTNYGSTVVHY